MSESQAYTVLIDGYNVIKRHPAWEPLTLRDGRARLLECLGRTRWPMPVSRVLVVFDGRASEGPGPRSDSTIQVRFASPSADAYIREAIQTSARPSRLLVISDDGEILRTAKSHGTRRQSTRWLLQRGSPVRRNRETPSDKATLPAATARRITDELADRWL